MVHITYYNQTIEPYIWQKYGISFGTDMGIARSRSMRMLRNHTNHTQYLQRA